MASNKPEKFLKYAYCIAVQERREEDIPSSQDELRSLLEELAVYNPEETVKPKTDPYDEISSLLEDLTFNGSEDRSKPKTSPVDSSSLTSPNEGTEFIEPKRDQEWFKKSSSRVKKTDVYSYAEKFVFGEIPDEKAVHPLEKRHDENRFFYKSEKYKREERRKMRKEFFAKELETMNEKRRKEKDLEMQLEEEANEIGQHKRFKKFFGKPGTCECRVTEHPPEWSDFMIEKIHANYHRIYHLGLHTDESILISSSENLTFVRILMNEKNPWTERVQQLLIFIDIEFGFSEGFSASRSVNRQAYLALDDVKIVGCVIAEPIKTGFKIVSPLTPNPKYGNKVSVLCGISRIWVLFKYEKSMRTLLATALLDILRWNFIPGESLSVDDIAFAEPHLELRHFAASYCKKDNFIIYGYQLH